MAPIVRLNFAATALLTVALPGEEINTTKAIALGLAAAAIIVGGKGLLRVADNRSS